MKSVKEFIFRCSSGRVLLKRTAHDRVFNKVKLLMNKSQLFFGGSATFLIDGS